MNREERQKIYLLLHQFYPRAKQLQSPETLTAWGFVLENYTYEDVKSKVIAYAARHKFFPDIADITADLLPISDAPETHEMAASKSRYFAEWEKRTDELNRYYAASGGRCQIRKLWDADKNAGECMMEGLFLRRHYPEACVGCRRLEVGGGCSQEVITKNIDRERRGCIIMRGHSGEGRQADVLKKYWRELCPICSVHDCFWFKSMKAFKEDVT